jgi:hypothetical protein
LDAFSLVTEVRIASQYLHLGELKPLTAIGAYWRRMSFHGVFSVDDGMKLTNARTGFMVRELSHHLHPLSETQRFGR